MGAKTSASGQSSSIVSSTPSLGSFAPSSSSSARMRHRCLLIFWILITLGCSIKSLYVFFVSDWTSLEDWVAISYLAFYTAVTLVVVAFTKECGTTEGGVVHDYGAPPAYKA